MGIKYSLLSPEPVHILATSGLGIYKSQLKGHDGNYDAMLGGTHESFEYFAEAAGGVGNLMSHFTNGLQEFREGAMPRILGNPVTLEEIQAAKIHNLNLGNVEYLEELEDYERFEELEDENEDEECVCCGELKTDITIEEELGGKPQAPSQPAGVASRISFSGDGFPSGGGEVTNQEANVADKKLVGNGGMMWLPKMDVVSVQIPQPQFESTCRGRRGGDMPRYKCQVRDLEDFENFPEISAEKEEIISEEWLVMKEKKEDLKERK